VGRHNIHTFEEPITFRKPDFFNSWLSEGLPATFKITLKNQEAQEGNSVTLHCELSKPGVRVEWWKGEEMLKTGEKYQLRLKEAKAELLIRKAQPEDSGVYRCVCEDQKTEATIKVNGMNEFQEVFKFKFL